MPLFISDSQTLMLNVKDFGATGNGTTDDSAAITSAFTAASAASRSRVYFPAGAYISSTEQDIPSGCTVEGEGYNSIIRRNTGSSSYLVNVLRINSKSNVRIKNLQIDGQKADIIANYVSTAQDGNHLYKTCCGVYVTGTATSLSTNVTIDHCWIHDAYYGNIQPDAVDGMNIESNYLYNGRDNQINARVNASSGGTCSHVTVRGNIVTGAGPQTTANQYSGIQFIRGTYITITNNVCQNFGNTVSTEGDGIGLEGSRHVTIANNICTHNLSQGIKVDRTIEGIPATWDAVDTYVIGDCVSYLSNNFVALTYNIGQTPPSTATSNSNWSYQASGPYVQYSTDVTISGNVCADNNYHATYSSILPPGIFIQYAENVVISGNTCYGNYYGFQQGQNVTSLTIKDNSFYNNQAAGVVFYNNTNAYGPFIIEDNYVARNGAKGIDVVVPCTIRGNTSQNNVGAGISLSISGTVVQTHPFFLIERNVLTDNGDSGILVNGSFASAVPVEIRDNYAPASSVQPRLLGENGTPVRCVNNRVDTQATELWYLTSSSSVWIDENDRQIKSVTANYTVVSLDNIILVAPASNTTITLPAPNTTHPSANPGRTITISKTSTSVNTVTVATAGGTINGATMIGNQSSETYVSDGTNWNIVSTADIVPWALMSGDPSTYGGNTASAANSAYFVGVTLPAMATLTGIRTRFVTGGGGHYDLGIYDSGGNLLAHSGSTATASGNQTYSLGTPLALAPGRYWLALWIDNTSDQVYSRSANSGGVDVIQSVSATLNLPATNSGAVNTTYKPFILGLVSGGWS